MRICPNCHKGVKRCQCLTVWWCAACGECLKKENSSAPRHTCDSSRIKKINDSRKAHDDLGIEHTPSFSERLSSGFEMMADDPPNDED